MNCFLIDDDHEDLEIFRMALEDVDKSHACATSTDPIEALNILNNNKDLSVDLIFVDLNMPKMNGKDCFIELKKDERLKSTPTYFYSTHKDDQIAEEVINMGAAGFIKKPSSVKELSKILQEIINGHMKN